MEEKMPKLSNYFGSDDCFFFKLVAASSAIGAILAWMVVS
tara:strand:+ start:1002 stop:1121 length:120 start_codon:yes stop_codon:yes gene_type:complete